MARGRRLRKSVGGELEMSKENGTASDDTILLPNVAMSDVRQLLFLYFRFYKVTMLESTNATGEGRMGVYF
jgi:hypothetical protein